MKYFINYKDEFSSRTLLALVIFLVIFTETLSSANYLSVGSAQYPHVAPSPSVNHGRSGGVVQEKECFVARLCEYKILAENFSCKVSEYVISNGVERSLPKWLWFNEGNETLKGIPSRADEGLSEILIIGLRKHQNNPVGYICGLLTVKIVVWSLKYFPLFAQNFPASPVINDRLSKPSASQGFTCQFHEPIVLASLVLAGNFHEMDGKQKINVLDWLLQSYHISIYDVFMLSSNEDSLKGLLQTSHVLASGPGANRSASGLSTIITWHVRCGVMHLNDPLFQVMEKLSQQLTFINNVSYAPIGWHVVTGFQKHHVRRRRNVVGTTTPAYSTIPISQATVITTKIKIKTTTYVSPKKTFTWSRPLPTFSSPYTVNKTSLYNPSSTISSRFNNTIIPSQYNSISSTSPMMSSTMSPLSQITSASKQESPKISQYKSSSPTLPVISSPGTISSLVHISSSKQTPEISQYKSVSSTQSANMSAISLLSPSRQTTEISQHESVRSTLPVMSQSRNKSVIFQISSSKQQTSSNSIKTSSQIHSTSGVTRLHSISATSQLPSLELRTFVQSSLTRSENQRSTNVIVPSSRSITSSVPPTVQTVITNASLSTTVMTTATQTINLTTSLLQSSYSNYIVSVSLSSSQTYSPVLRVTTSGIINETKSAEVNTTSFGSSTAHTRSIPSITTTLSTNIAVTTQRSYTIDPSYTPFISSGSSVHNSSSIPSPFLPCTNSCSVSTFSNLNFTSTSREQQYTTTLYQASIRTSESILSSSRITGTLVLNTKSVAPANTKTSNVDKTPESTCPMLTSGIISKSLQSSDYINSKIIKTSATNSTIYSSRLGTGSKEIMPVSSSGAMSSQLTSGSGIGSKVTSISVMKLSSTGKTLHIMTSESSSEYKLSLSLVSSTARFATTVVNTPTEQLRSTYSLIETTPASTYTLPVKTKTIRSGSLITNIVPSTSVPSLFTSHISGAISSYITHSDAGHSSMLSPSTLTSSVDQPAFRTQTSRTLSPYTVSFSSRRGSPYKSSSSNKVFAKSTLTVLTTTLSPVFLSSNQTHTASSVATIPSSYLLSSYTTATSTSILVAFASSYMRTSPSSVVTNTLSLHSLSSYKTYTSPSSVVTTIPSSFLSYHTPLSFPTISSSSDFLSSYHSSTSSSNVVTITVLSGVPSSHTTATSPPSVVATVLSSDQLPSLHTTSSLSTAPIVTRSSYTTNSSTSTVVSISSSSIYISYRTPASPSSAVTIPPYSLSYKIGTSPSPIVTITPSSNVLSSYHSSTSPSSIFTTPSLSYLSSQHTPTSLLAFVATTSSSYHTSSLPSSYATVSSLSVFPSLYHTPTSSPTVDTVTPLSKLKSSYHASTSLHTSTITPSLHPLTAHTIFTSPTSVLTIISSPHYLSSYHTSTSPSSATTITLSSYLSSYHTLASSSVAIITPSFVLSSYHTPTSPLSPFTVTSSVFLSSYHTPISSASVATITPPVYPSSSHNAVLSPISPTESLRTSLSNLPSPTTPPSSASHKTFSLSFLSSSIASSQPSISSDLSTGLSVSYTLTKLSSQTSRLARPSYTSRQSPHTSTVLTLTSIKMPVITSSSGLSPSSPSSQSSSTIVTLPTIPSKASPKIYNNFDLLRVTVGKVFSVQIPADTFHDREDGNTRNLRLECLTVAHTRLSSNSWLQFNSTTQTLYGLVLKSQLGKISSEYLLTASDRDGNTVYDAFTVVIEESSKLLAAVFSVKLTGINLETFNRDIDNILSFVQTVAGYYGDKDESMIQILSLTEGSVITTWSNTSLQTCDEDLINDIASKLTTRQGTIQSDFYNALSPRFIAENIFVNYTGPCVVPSTENPSVSELSSHETSPWLKYVLPALVVAVVIFVIAVGFLLVRRHSGVKILKEDKQIFKRRKPIILDGEQEMSVLSGKPIELPEDSLSPIRFPRESSFGTPEYDEELPSPILPAPSYQRLPPRYSDGGSKRYNTPPPPYKLPPSY